LAFLSPMGRDLSHFARGGALGRFPHSQWKLFSMKSKLVFSRNGP
jgi:hypothetical protein